MYVARLSDCKCVCVWYDHALIWLSIVWYDTAKLKATHQADRLCLPPVSEFKKINKSLINHFNYMMSQKRGLVNKYLMHLYNISCLFPVRFWLDSLSIQKVNRNRTKELNILFVQDKIISYSPAIRPLTSAWWQQPEQRGPDLSLSPQLSLEASSGQLRQHVQHVLGLPRDLLPFGHAQNELWGGILTPTISTSSSGCGGADALIWLTSQRWLSFSSHLQGRVQPPFGGNRTDPPVDLLFRPPLTPIYL